MTFEEKLNIYAELLVVHGLNVQPGQLVNINAECYHRDFAMLVTEAAYKRGAKYVQVDLIDARSAKIRIESSAAEHLQFVPKYITEKYNELVDEVAANLKIVGSEDPDILANLDPKKINTIRMHQHLAVKRFYEEGIGKSKVHWTVAAAATPAWGLKVFPNVSAQEAEKKLWDAILTACRADKRDCLSLWQSHNTALQKRAKSMTELKIKELRFTGPGTDLIVTLSPKAVFKGGTDMSPRNVAFEPNLPTEEVFTTPDYRGVRGKVKATRPIIINGKLVSGLVMEFEAGQITKFSATDGEATFREYISSDEGANRLGEVALVGVDSPIFRSGLVFQEILFDENAACHIAVGSAYKFCLAGGPTMTKEELAEIGCNESTVHTDMMISSEEVDVTATTYSGQAINLISKGQWLL